MEVARQLRFLAEADLRRRHGLNVVTLRRSSLASFDTEEDADTVVGTPTPDLRLEPGDRLILFGKLKDIDRFCQS